MMAVPAAGRVNPKNWQKLKFLNKNNTLVWLESPDKNKGE
jgi:hypothetical protein